MTVTPPSFIPAEGWIKRYVDLYTPLSESPPEAHFATAMALLSAAVGHRAVVRWGRSCEPCTVWAVLEGRSAVARKTTTSETAMAVASRAFDHEGERLVIARRLGHTSDRGLIEMVAPKDAEQAKSWEEGHGQPPGVFAAWDEFGAALGRPGDVKGSDWIGRIQTTLMSMYGGRHGGIQTGANKLPGGRCALSIVATMTRAELEQRVSAGLLKSGFMGRFVLVPFGGRHQVLPRPPEFTPAMVDEEGQLSLFLRAVAESNAIGDVFGLLTPDAAYHFDQWYITRSVELEKRAELTQTEEDVAISSVFFRLQTTAMKVAALVAISNRMGDLVKSNPLPGTKIQVTDMEIGIGLAEFALAEVKSLLETDEMSVERIFQQKVLKKLEERNGAGPMTMRELLSGIRSPMTYRQKKFAVWALHPEELHCEEVDKHGKTERVLVSRVAE
jgi:hypothetical protein